MSLTYVYEEWEMMNKEALSKEFRELVSEIEKMVERGEASSDEAELNEVYGALQESLERFEDWESEGELLAMEMEAVVADNKEAIARIEKRLDGITSDIYHGGNDHSLLVVADNYEPKGKEGTNAYKLGSMQKVHVGLFRKVSCSCLCP